MDHYVDIQLRNDPEFPCYQIMDALFAKLHRVLVQVDSGNIGVSFPDAGDAQTGLGGCLRLHGAQQSLKQVMDMPWLSGVKDYVEASDVCPVPGDVKHYHVRRVQAKSSPGRLRRRQMKRKGWTEEQALEAIPDSLSERLSYPYLTVKSVSTGQVFRLFINQKQTDVPTTGNFNTYGFSGTASVVWF